MNDNDQLPTALYESTLKIGTVELRCAVLDNGQRVIHADDVQIFIDAMANGTLGLVTPEMAVQLAEFCRATP